MGHKDTISDAIESVKLVLSSSTHARRIEVTSQEGDSKQIC